MAFSYRGALHKTTGYSTLSMSIPESAIHPGDYRSGDMLLAVVRSNTGFTGSGFRIPQGWWDLTGTHPKNEAGPVAGIFVKRLTTASDFTATHTFSGWKSGTNLQVLGYMTVVRGLSNLQSDWYYKNYSNGDIPERVDTQRGAVDFALYSYELYAGDTGSAILATDGWKLMTSARTDGGTNTLRSAISLYYRELTVDDPAYVRKGQVTRVGTTRRQDLAMVTVADTFSPKGKPITQPFNKVYVGGEEAKLNLGSKLIW